MKKLVFLCSLLFIVFSACTKLPEKVESSSVKFSIVMSNNAEEYIVRFSGGLENENSSTVLQAIKGTIVIEGKDGPLVTMPYEVDKVFPFSIGIIDIEEKVDKNIMIQLAELLSINMDELEQAKESDTIYIDEKKVTLTINSYKKENIVNLLKGMVDEEKK